MNTTTRLLRFDSIGGASGDMILAATSGLGISIEETESDLCSLGIGKIRLKTEQTVDHGIAGTRLTVITEHDHKHRNLSDIENILNSSHLPEKPVLTAIAIFRMLAEAEASIHGTTPDHIHFHEVGALDSIADITGASIAFHKLQINAIDVSPLPLGFGAGVSAALINKLGKTAR